MSDKSGHESRDIDGKLLKVGDKVIEAIHYDPHVVTDLTDKHIHTKDGWSPSIAWVLVVPADDDEPIDWDWLRKIGFQDMETGLESPNHVLIVNAWGMDFTVCNGKPKIKTRGDVRKLCKALGITLGEPK